MDYLPIKLLLGFVAISLLVGCSPKKADYLDRMAEEHEGDSPTANVEAEMEVNVTTGKTVRYATVGGEEISGYLATPGDTNGSTPGIIVIHEWWGLNDNIRRMADKLASEGYSALAVDLYKGKVAETPDSAGTYARSVDDDEAIDNLTQAYNYLAEQQGAQDIGVIGWCFGGAWSLQTALAHPKKIDATVIYYGRLVTDTEKLQKLQMPILGIFGAEDEGIPPEQVKEFESALNKVYVPNSIHIYEGAGHAFANPSGERYVKEAAEDAWQKTIQFLNKNLK